MSLPSIKGKRGTFSPEWAHAAAVDAPGGLQAGRIYQELYTALAPRWLAAGCYVHAVRVFAHDQPVLDGLYWLGFGLNNVDAVRDLAPLASTAEAPAASTGTAPPLPQDVTIRRATAEDVDAVTALGEALQRHLADVPIYLPLIVPDTRADHLAWLAGEGNRQWLAFRGATPIAELRCEPTNYTAVAIAADPQTVFITSAYTVPGERRGGVAAALLHCLLAEVRAAGAQRCATDFESANLPGARFWLRHFQPTAYSVIRYVDERLGYAHARRSLETIW
jgi:GNAT superfamily N-acetyltransferase